MLDDVEFLNQRETEKKTVIDKKWIEGAHVWYEHTHTHIICVIVKNVKIVGNSKIVEKRLLNLEDTDLFDYAIV